MLTTQQLYKIQKLIKDSQGDDLERAHAAFRGLSSPQMEMLYGQSGKTRQQILDGYREQRKEDIELLAEFNKHFSLT